MIAGVPGGEAPAPVPRLKRPTRETLRPSEWQEPKHFWEIVLDLAAELFMWRKQVMFDYLKTPSGRIVLTRMLTELQQYQRWADPSTRAKIMTNLTPEEKQRYAEEMHRLEMAAMRTENAPVED